MVLFEEHQHSLFRVIYLKPVHLWGQETGRKGEKEGERGREIE